MKYYEQSEIFIDKQFIEKILQKMGEIEVNPSTLELFILKKLEVNISFPYLNIYIIFIYKKKDFEIHNGPSFGNIG